MSGTSTQDQILDAVMAVIVREGVRGASMRNVAEEADVSLGLISYHFDDKRSLIEAAFKRATGALFALATDAAEGHASPHERVRAYLRGAFSPEFLTDEYLALRISLWAVSRTDPDIAAIEEELYLNYASRLRHLISDARPELSPIDVAERATDTIVIQNGLWLNWARFQNTVDLNRSLERCERIALG